MYEEIRIEDTTGGFEEMATSAKVIGILSLLMDLDILRRSAKSSPSFNCLVEEVGLRSSTSIQSIVMAAGSGRMYYIALKIRQTWSDSRRSDAL